LEAVYIFFDTATYDEIERDEKVTMEAQLGLIGGTMGLFTGFSILSGVEIIYYLLRCVVVLLDQSFNPQVLHVSQGPKGCTL